MQKFRIKPRDRAQELVLAYLNEHSLEEGQRLPTEREFSARWGINRCTLHSAIVRLEKACCPFSGWSVISTCLPVSK